MEITVSRYEKIPKTVISFILTLTQGKSYTIFYVFL